MTPNFHVSFSHQGDITVSLETNLSFVLCLAKARERVDQSSYLSPGEIGGFQREETQDVIRDIDWSTRNVMLGYDVAGN